MHRPSLISLALVAMLAAGCGNEPKPIEPTASPSDSSKPGPQIEPPTLPEAATEESAEGAASFVDYYLEVLTYAAQTGDTGLLAELSSDTCKGCKAYIEQFASRHAAGGWREGGEWSAGAIEISQFGRDLALVTELGSASGTYRETARSETRSFEATTETVTFVIGRAGSQWSVIELALGDMT